MASARGERILVVEDDGDLAHVLEYNLRQAGFEPHWAPDGRAALRLIKDGSPALVLLDLMLPDLSGMEVLKTLRAEEATRGIPVILLTARGEEADRVEGLSTGADDYVTKPFSVRELLLRVKGLLSRASRPASAAERYGALEMDRGAYRVSVAGKEVPLTATEFRLLTDLIDGAGRVRTREALLDRVWGYAPEVVSRTVDTHVRRLREKLGKAGELVETVRGVGYRFQAPGRASGE